MNTPSLSSLCRRGAKGVADCDATSGRATDYRVASQWEEGVRSSCACDGVLYVYTTEVMQ